MVKDKKTSKLQSKQLKTKTLAIEELVEMGFNRKRSRIVFEQVKGSLARAAEILAIDQDEQHAPAYLA